MATPGSSSMAIATAFGDTALCRRPCRSRFTRDQRHHCTARTSHWKFCCPERTQTNLTHVAAALPQVSQDHRTLERSAKDAENGSQQLLKHKSNGNGLSTHRDQPNEHDAEEIQQESLQLLDWPAVCSQVACFAATPMAADRLLQNGLPMGTSQADSERLLQETAEALEAKLSLEGVQDVRAMLHALDEGRALHPLHLTAIASTLLAARAVEEQLQPEHGALRRVALGIKGSLPDLADSIYQCIHKKDGRILDEASEKLAAIRAQRQENLRALRLAMEEWARELHRKGAAERSQVVVRRNRLCVAIKAGRQSDLPKGSMSLATSSTGSTMYMDPEPTVALNNREAMLSGQEEEEEARILAALSSAVAARSARIWQILGAIAALDVCMARAGHAAWCGGIRPRFLAPEEATQHGCVQVGGMRHPLLLQGALDPLPEPPSAASEDTELSYLDSFAPGADVPSQAASQADADAGNHQARAKAPQPVDFWVPAGVSVVTLTGPNTGGKTASLKALGLAAAMSKAGLFLPLQPAEGESHTPAIAWFDGILADVGDSQNLQESLSTFSGHIKRVRKILGSITKHSLVLLDEVGSGTDPTEGAALAGALLDALASRALLTLATTHHASLKDMAAKDERFCNAGVEFDLKTLRPTYRLTWQSVGVSNALAVAEGLGFDPLVIQEARKVAEEASFSVSRTGDRAAALRESLAEELEEARLVVQAAAAARKRAEHDVQRLQAEIASLQKEEQTRKAASSPAKEKAELAEKQAQLDKALHSYRSGNISAEKARQIIAQVRASAPQIGAAAFDLNADSRAPRATDWEPAHGDAVSLLTMGGSKGQVTAGPDARGKYTVKVGKLLLQAQARDMEPLQREQRKPGTKQKQAASLQQQGAQKAKPQAESQEPAAMTIQFEHNTRDIRGMRADDVASVIDEAIACNPSGSSIFIVHGMGTGRLRTEVHKALKQHSQIARFELEGNSGGGCTMAVIR